MIENSTLFSHVNTNVSNSEGATDIPVSIATAAAIVIGEYSVTAIVAVLLLIGGMLEPLVIARAGNALDTLVRLLTEHIAGLRDGRQITILLEEVAAGE